MRAAGRGGAGAWAGLDVEWRPVMQRGVREKVALLQVYIYIYCVCVCTCNLNVSCPTHVP